MGFSVGTKQPKLLLSDAFNTKAQNMPEMLRRPGLCPGPRWGSLQRSPRPPSCDALLLRAGEVRDGGGREREGEGREGRGGRGGCLQLQGGIIGPGWVIPCEVPDKLYLFRYRIVRDAENRTMASLLVWTKHRNVTEGSVN